MVLPEVRAMVELEFKAIAPPLALLPIVTVPVEVPVLIEVLKLESFKRETLPPVTVSPALPVNKPAEVIVPVLVVEMAPEVVILSPDVRGERVEVPEFLCQY